MISTKNTQDAIDYHYETKEIFNAAEMTICKWSSNDENLMNAMKPEDRCDDDILKVLGLIWNRKSDTISLCKVTIEENVLTKRKILQVISCMHDPIGLFAPAVLRSKLLLQEIWKLKLNWDDIVPDVIVKKWKREVSTLKHLHTIKIGRYVAKGVDQNVKYDIVTFTDASKGAY